MAPMETGGNKISGIRDDLIVENSSIDSIEPEKIITTVSNFYGNKGIHGYY